MLYVILAWAGAVVVALAILGFCAYELVWKTRRLQSDLSRLQAAVSDLNVVQTRLVEIQRRGEELRQSLHPLAEG